MLVYDILTEHKGANETQVLTEECGDFLKASQNIPVFKSLPSSYNDFHKVKVRIKKKKGQFTDTFNQALNHSKLRQRAVFAYGYQPVVESEQDLFYVLPINGYRFMYSKEVTNSSKEYKQAFNTIFEQFNDKQEANQLIHDLLQYTYTTEKLVEGIESRSEIIFYNIPYYYAVRASTIDYEELINYN